MKDDNTTTKTSRRHTLTPHMRLRTETAKKLQKLGSRVKAKRAKHAKPTLGEEDAANTNTLPQVPRAKRNVLNESPKPSSKFRKRQLHKSWLPTHLYHAKRAHITPPSEPLWRFAIPLTPTEKCYRTTHRASSSRGCLAWDTSYMSTLRLEGVEASLLGLLRGLGVEDIKLAEKIGAKWRRGTRGWAGWVREQDGEKRLMTRTNIVWRVCEAEYSGSIEPSVVEKQTKRQIFLRIHPAAFLQVWKEVLKLGQLQRPPVMVEDLRFEIGSIEITGPGSTEALISVLQPAADVETASPENISAKLWPFLVTVTNPASLPHNALLAFEISDPRLHHPPQTVIQPNPSNLDDKLLELLSNWPPDKTQSSPTIFDRTARFAACRLLPSQKAIHRRKGAALPGTYPNALPGDPRIPILLIASRSGSDGAHGSWTLLLPWKCVLPVWYSLMHYPLSSGGNPRFGGLQEKRQVAFEQGGSWFPGDYPGTNAGWEWEMLERAKRKAQWEKRPKGKRVEWESVDLGDGKKGEIGMGWACDWERLFQGQESSSSSIAEPAHAKACLSEPSASGPTVQKSTDSSPPNPPKPPPFNIHHILTPVDRKVPSDPPPTALTTISLSLLARGSPSPCARIYRLPTTNPTLRQKWLALTGTTKSTQQKPHPLKNPPRTSFPKNAPPHEIQQHIAASLLAPPSATAAKTTAPKPLRAGDAAYPVVPGEEDLIGFVTTGNFNLGEGKASAIGCVVLARILGFGRASAEGNGNGNGDGAGRKEGQGRVCIVRDAGQALGRLARWEFVG